MDPNAIMAEIADLEARRKRIVDQQNNTKKEKKELSDEINSIQRIKNKLNNEVDEALSVVKVKSDKIPQRGTMFSVLFMERSKNVIQGKDMSSALEEVSSADKRAKERFRVLESDINKYGRQINEIDQKIQDLRRQLSICMQGQETAGSI